MGSASRAFISMLFVSSFASVAGAQLGVAMPPLEESPMLQQWSGMCQQSKTQLDDCDREGNKIPEACKSDDAIAGACTDPSANGCARGNVVSQGQAGNSASKTAAACQAQTDKCKKTCGKKISSCDPGKYNNDKMMAQGAQGAMTNMKSYCEKEGQPRADAARKQAEANKQAKNDSEKNAEQNKGQGGGGMPQMPQMPQGGGGGDQGQQAATPPEPDPVAPPDPCLLNPRGCMKGEVANPIALGAGAPGESEGGDYEDDSSGSIGGPEAPFFPSMTGGDAGGAEGGAMMAGGGMGGGGGANAAAAKPDEEKKKRGLAAVNSGTDGGGGGGGGGSYASYGDDDGDTKKKSSKYGRPLFATARSAKAAGFTSAGGRTNWEKIKLRYRDNQPTFLRGEDKDTKK